MIQRKILSWLFIISFLAIISCQQDNLNMTGEVKLQFSADTLSFDTIFTTIGSTTAWLKVKNPESHSVIISRIFLAGSENSPFRLNINGVNNNEVQNVSILSGDSIFIFVEVTVNPTGQNNPMVIQDSIVFEVNGNRQDVDLLAFGQDFHLFDGKTLKTQHWQNDKPYLIYNSILVDSLEKLTIDPGCRIYFHQGASLFVQGTLNVQGTCKEPVTFMGDRLEKDYADTPGQWGAWKLLENQSKYIYGGIHFLKGSKDNLIDHAVIKNASKGIQVDSMGFSSKPMLVLSNTIIENMTLNCLDARTTSLKANNCIFANSGSYSVALLLGGNYEFYHCTIANYYNYRTSVRKEPSLVVNNYYTYDNKVYAYDLTKAYFANCIIDGMMDNEIVLDPIMNAQFNYRFQNCLIKSNSSFYPKDQAFGSSVFNKNPLFTDSSKNDYSLDPLSPARNAGNKNIAIQFPTDLNEHSRLEDEGPDVGALEWQSSNMK
ncbi:MAG TPA: hypothetical protein VGK10_09440 [Prolixibacteraceae bacterium]